MLANPNEIFVRYFLKLEINHHASCFLMKLIHSPLEGLKEQIQEVALWTE